MRATPGVSEPRGCCNGVGAAGWSGQCAREERNSCQSGQTSRSAPPKKTALKKTALEKPAHKAPEPLPRRLRHSTGSQPGVSGLGVLNRGSSPHSAMSSTYWDSAEG